VLGGFVQIVAAFDPGAAHPQCCAMQRGVAPAVSHEYGMLPMAKRAAFNRSRIRLAFAATPYVGPKFLRNLATT
jgi:hypothetical protein